MSDYALPEADIVAGLQTRILVIGDGFPQQIAQYRLTRPADPLADLGDRWSAILIDGAAITPAIAAALHALPADTPVIVAAGDGDADSVGLVMDNRLTIVERPIRPGVLESALEDARLHSNAADAGSLARDERIMALQRDAQRIQAAISELTAARANEDARPVTAARIRAHLRARRLRDRFFSPDLFADPAWDMLLDLGASRLEGHKVSVSSLCIAAAVPTTTALRWVKAMVDRGIFARENDPDDARRTFIHLSAQAATALDACLDAVLNQPGQ